MTKQWIASLCIALGIASTPAIAQTAQDTFRQLEQFRNGLANLSAVTAKPLGPYDIGTRCPYCDTEFAGICWKHAEEVWGVHIDFSESRKRLGDAVRDAEQDSRASAGSNWPIQAWIDGLRPLSNRFNAEADKIMVVEQAIKGGKRPSAVDGMKVRLALRSMSSTVARSAQQLQAGTRALADILQRQSGYRASIGQAMAALTQDASSQLAWMEQSGKGKRCQTGMKEKFEAVKVSYRASADQIAAAFAALDTTGRGAENGLAGMLGTFTSAQGTLNSVQESIAAARDSELGSFIERLHLSAAKKQWNDMATAAGR